MSSFTNGNADDITRAVEGLDIFTKSWCMNCSETEAQNGLVFRCGVCEFQREDGICLIKAFSLNHRHKYPLDNFGSMGSH